MLDLTGIYSVTIKMGYCRFGNVRENLIFTNICEFVDLNSLVNLLPCEFKVLTNIKTTYF